MKSLNYQLFDVFTDRPFAGNQLAVVPDADGIDPALMQRIANEFSLPETSFLMSSNDPDCEFRFRIFTPERELPMAGHPTIGSAFALAHLNLVDAGAPHFVVELGVGPTVVEMTWGKDGLETVWMSQKDPEFGPGFQDAAVLGRLLRLEASAIPTSRAPAQIVSSGVPLLFIPLRSRADVDEAVLDRGELVRLSQRLRIHECPVYVFTLESGPDDAHTYSRMFAPVFGIAEDPATGGAGGPLAAYVSRYFPETVSVPGRLLNRQGVRMRRPSLIHISLDENGTETFGLRVGGQAVRIGEGTLYP